MKCVGSDESISSEGRDCGIERRSAPMRIMWRWQLISVSSLRWSRRSSFLAPWFIRGINKVIEIVSNCSTQLSYPYSTRRSRRRGSQQDRSSLHAPHFCKFMRWTISTGIILRSRIITYQCQFISLKWGQRKAEERNPYVLLFLFSSSFKKIVLSTPLSIVFMRFGGKYAILLRGRFECISAISSQKRMMQWNQYLSANWAQNIFHNYDVDFNTDLIRTQTWIQTKRCVRTTAAKEWGGLNNHDRFENLDPRECMRTQGFRRNLVRYVSIFDGNWKMLYLLAVCNSRQWKSALRLKKVEEDPANTLTNLWMFYENLTDDVGGGVGAE